MFQCMKNSETASENAVGQSDAALRRLRTVQQICAAQVFFKVMLCLMNFQTHRSSSGMLFHFQILQPSLAGNTQIKELTFTLLKGVSSDWLLHWSWCKSWSRGWDIFCHVLHCNTRVTTLQWTANCRHNITVHTRWPLYEITCEGGAWEEAALRAWMLLLKPQLTTVQVQNCSQIISLFL